jgi:hypothetical protein
MHVTSPMAQEQHQNSMRISVSRSNLSKYSVRSGHVEMAEQVVEEWRSIPGFNGRYEASTEGRIRNARTLFVRRPVVNWAGYCRVRISPQYGVEAKLYSVHRLIMAAFATNPDNLPQIDHIDCSKSNNALRNLEYVSAQENYRRAWNNGLITTTARAVAQFDLEGNLIKMFESQHAAEMDTGVSQACISKSCTHNRPGCGYRWEFASTIDNKND